MTEKATKLGAVCGFDARDSARPPPLNPGFR